MKLIDKDAVLAKIKKLKDTIPYYSTLAEKYAYKEGIEDAMNKIYSIKVKEVDLEKEYKDFLKCDDGRSMFETAKHFFELGINTSNQLTWEDIAYIEDITSTILAECKDKNLYDTQETFCKEVLKRFKEQKEELL